uniref:Putative secreted protein n=1 Tax=Xenopsylla cheopis TaxID=163159 RepID=A0A6M2DZW2_XENCH
MMKFTFGLFLIDAAAFIVNWMTILCAQNTLNIGINFVFPFAMMCPKTLATRTSNNFFPVTFGFDFNFSTK